MPFYLAEVRESRGSRHYYYILDVEGDSEGGDIVGELLLDFSPGGAVYIMNIEMHGGPGTLGVSGVRDLLRAIKEEFPEATSIVGGRITGTRRGLSEDRQWVERDI